MTLIQCLITIVLLSGGNIGLLHRFLEHALRDLDYEVRDKMFLETVLDVEFQDGLANEKALFYSDTGHSFDSVMLYGHEFSLTIFEVLVFR